MLLPSILAHQSKTNLIVHPVDEVGHFDTLFLIFQFAPLIAHFCRLVWEPNKNLCACFGF
jgi:hypothetical protein